MQTPLRPSRPAYLPASPVTAFAWRRWVFVMAALACLGPWLSPALALALGVLVTRWVGVPHALLDRMGGQSRLTHGLLQASVVGLGFGMNAHSALAAGRTGLALTVASIAGTLTAGIVLGRLLRLDRVTGFLIAAGTAICGGSAIAALTPVTRATPAQSSVALGTVFSLNALALILFPLLGQWLHLTPQQFGLWCALAIHDTSSVVGAAARFGPEALQLATTVKLARALWIIPIALGTATAFGSGRSGVHMPWFIGLFILAMLLHTYVPALAPLAQGGVVLAKAGLTLTLFLIGTTLTADRLRAVGWRPLAQGIGLWALISAGSLYAILRVSV
ncbi:putative sulfate exporter family transporter [Spirosoma luteolum]